MFKEYNELFDKVVKEFGSRFYKEVFDEEFDINDIDIIDYEGYKHIFIICDEYYDLEQMLFVLEFNIPIKVLREWYDERLEANYNGETMENLYNFFRKSCYKESLKKSEENVKKAKEELEKIIKGSK